MADQKSQKKSWSEEDIARLAELTKKHVNSEKQIMWADVAAEFPTRTKNQLKTFFFNYVKETQDPSDYKTNS